MANNTTGFTRIIKAAGYSWKGLRAAWINEAAFRQEGVAVLLAVVIACWLDVDAITRVLLISSVMLVMIVEILNSAIEAVVDRIGSEYHELSGMYIHTYGTDTTFFAVFLFNEKGCGFGTVIDLYAETL